MGIRTVTSCDPVRAEGKFLRVNGEPFLVRGVAYGTFAPREDGASVSGTGAGPE